MASPARSCVVKILPDRPRTAWLWLVWRARVDLPESMVPVKNWSSATGEHHAMSGNENRDQHLRGRERAVQTHELGLDRERRPAEDREVLPAGDEHVADSGAYVEGELAEPAEAQRLVPGHHLRALAENLPPGRDHVVDRPATAVQLPEAGLPAEERDAVAQLGLVVDVQARLRR